MAERFEFAFEAKYVPFLASLGVVPTLAWVELRDDSVRAQFGRWSVETPLTNVRCVVMSGPYRWYRAIGVRLSFTDRGVTFGSTTAGGVCFAVHEPVTAMDPTGALVHPGVTVTVAERERFAAALREAAGLPSA